VEACRSEISTPITSIPEEFKAFQQAFSNKFFTMLPAHHSYDCAIPLKDGKDMPYGLVYPMTLSETAGLKEHINCYTPFLHHRTPRLFLIFLLFFTDSFSFTFYIT
jgi:hypothetical protein